jgi:hypothetical protein
MKAEDEDTRKRREKGERRAFPISDWPQKGAEGAKMKSPRRFDSDSLRLLRHLAAIKFRFMA